MGKKTFFVITKVEILKKWFLTIVLAVFIAFLFESSTSPVKVFYPEKYSQYVYKYSAENNIDPYLVFSIIKAESNFEEDAISRKNARGLMQISEITGNWGAQVLGFEGFTLESLFEPETNIMIGCWYVNKLVKEFGDDLGLVLAAYNAGSGNVSLWLEDRAYSSTGESLDRIPFKETERYVKKVLNNYFVYKEINSK